ncbi:MAG: FHA domain-containing protein [Clostridium sp.]|nr:FHA domain-containing protein [Clostridium sp.]
MEIRYQREINHNYMILSGPETENATAFECQMLSDNEIRGLLRFRLRRSGRGKEFLYDITSRQPLSRILDSRKLRGKEIRSIARSLLKTVETLPEYLLEEQELLLAPEYVYADPETLEVMLSLVPGRRSDFREELSSFLKVILEKTDHQDADGIMTAYHLYEESRKENYGIGDLLRCLEEPEETERQRTPREPGAGAAAQEVFRETGENMPGESLPGEKMARRDFPGGGIPRKGGISRKGRKPPGPGGILKKGLPVLVGAEFLSWYLLGLRGLVFPGTVFAGVFIAFSAWSLLAAKRSGRGEESREPAGKEALPEDRGGRDTGYRRILPMTTGEAEKREEEARARRMEKSFAEGTVLLGRAVRTGDLVLDPVRRNMDPVRVSYTPFVLGKHPELADCCVEEDAVSRMHARIDRREDRYFVTDLNSTNGTSVGGQLLEANETRELRDGDLLELAGVGFYVQLSGNRGAPYTQID